MPDSVTHHYFGHQVLERLPAEIRGKIDPGIYDRALQGPDPWSTIGFYGGGKKPLAVRSNVMHKTETGRFLVELSRMTAEYPEAPVFSVLAGFLCHYCLDANAHPYIICKGGDYDGTPETVDHKGGHVRLERSIDSRYIRKGYGAVPWHFSIPRRIMGLKRFPEALREPLDRAMKEVYGWDGGFDDLNRAMRDERLFYGLMQDPLGLVHLLLRPLSRGKTNFCMYSYFRRDTDGEKLDYMNQKRQPWNHPNDPDLTSTDSFSDLYDRALEEAVEMICTAYHRIGRGEVDALAACFVNRSYSTGFDCADPRNQAQPKYEPLRYKDKYRNT